MAPTKVRRSVKKRDGGGKSSQRLLAEASPESKCPICLDGFNNVASLDRCLHQFCFRCIHEWSKNKAECPLCKQPFHSIIHSVKGENDFKEFVLRPVENGAGPNAAAGDPSDRVLRPRVLRGRERRSRRAQQPVPSSSSPPLEDDVMFEGLSDAVSLAENQDVQQMVLRLTVHRRGRGEGRSLRRLRDQDVVAFRRALYRTGVRVRNSRDAGRQRNISAAYLRQNPACLRRLLPWLQRELTVLYGSHGSLVNIVQHIIMSRITNYNMEDSAIRDELRPFLLARTDHFLHELVSFARSTLSMEAYDQQAIYDCPAPSYEEGSSSDSSVIAISEDDDDDNDSEEDVTENPSVVPEHLPSVPSASGESLLSQSAWDDETPGPSYSTLLPSSSQSQGEGEEPSSSTAPPLKNLESDAVGSVSTGPADDEEEEECLIVGYVKPMAERTPELVHLSSDSSEEEQEAVTTETADTVTKTETSSVQLPSSPQAHERLPSPALPPSLAPSLSPQHTHSDSQSCTPSDRGRHAHQHRSRDRSRSRLRRSRERSGFKGHRNRRERTHRRSGSKERPERLRNTKSQDQVCTRSPSQTHSRQSPAVSVCSGSPRSDCSKRSPSRNESSSDTSRERDRYSHSLSLQERERGTGRARERTSGSPDSDSLLHSHRPRSRSRESQRGRKRRQRPMSSSSSTERSRLDKPSGKRKYKTRHLERAAHRQHGEGTAATLKRSGHGRKERRREQPPSRSPSVEIIYERQAPSSHTHSLQRKKRRHRKRRREQRSPTVITIDSDSDRTIDCLDRVIDVTDQTAADSDHEQRNRTPEQDELLNDSNLSNTCNLPSSNALLEPSSPLDPSTVSSDRSVNTEHCVDTNSHGLNTDTRESVPGFLPDVSVTTTPPSDTRLLESILQELKEFLPGVEQEAGQGVGPNPENPITSSFIQQENTASPQRDQSDMRGHTDTLNNKNTDSDTQQETQTDTVN